MMSQELSEFLLLLSAVLVLAAFFGRSFLRARARSSLARNTFVLLLVAAAAVAGWVGWSRLGPHLAAAPAAALPSAPAAESAGVGQAEPVPTAIAALQECTAPPAPGAVPDGNKASREEMVAARTAFQQYDAATNAFLKCLDVTIERVNQQFPNASAAELQTLHTLNTGAHNTAVDQEQVIADQLNAQVRAFKTKHPAP